MYAVNYDFVKKLVVETTQIIDEVSEKTKTVDAVCNIFNSFRYCEIKSDGTRVGYRFCLWFNYNMNVLAYGLYDDVIQVLDEIIFKNSMCCETNLLHLVMSFLQ